MSVILTEEQLEIIEKYRYSDGEMYNKKTGRKMKKYIWNYRMSNQQGIYWKLCGRNVYDNNDVMMLLLENPAAAVVAAAPAPAPAPAPPLELKCSNCGKAQIVVVSFNQERRNARLCKECYDFHFNHQ